MEGIRVGGEKGLARGGFKSDCQGIFSGGSDDHIRVVFMDDGNTPKALHEGEGLLGRGDDIPFIEVAYELGDDFCVGIGVELDIVGLEHLAQRPVVFNDAIVDNGNPEMLIKMRMGVFSGRFSMGRPPGMSNR